MSAETDIIAAELTKALAAERQARVRVVECAEVIAFSAVEVRHGEYAMAQLRDAVHFHRDCVRRREQAEAALKELTEEGPYR
jgi:hypothetical protein